MAGPLAAARFKTLKSSQEFRARMANHLRVTVTMKAGILLNASTASVMPKSRPEVSPNIRLPRSSCHTPFTMWRLSATVVEDLARCLLHEFVSLSTFCSLQASWSSWRAFCFVLLNHASAAAPAAVHAMWIVSSALQVRLCSADLPLSMSLHVSP